jgi:lipoyl(octanoyl) transferase
MAPEWLVGKTHVPYPEAVQAMEARVAAIRAGTAQELVWLLEHPPLYTAGTSAKPADLIAPERLPVFQSGRGGQYTYHGPGQRVGYVMLDLARRGPDLRRFIHDLEAWIIQALAAFGVPGERREGRVGIWVQRPDKGPGQEDKIAAIGVRVRRWVSFHGVAINLNPALEHFSGIVPCGIQGGPSSPYGVTSLHDLGVRAGMVELDEALRSAFDEVFGPITAA